MHLLAGLGNPGPRYQQTRHNVGFMLMDRLAHVVQGRFEPFRQGLICRTRLSGKPVLLLKPLTYMNRSGPAVKEVCEFYQVEPARLLVAYDDVALPLGKIRIRAAGSSGGQKGLESILEALGTLQVPRLRIGIGGGNRASSLSEYVLSEFSLEEKAVLEQVLDRCVEAVQVYLLDGIERAMTLFNPDQSTERDSRNP